MKKLQTNLTIVSSKGQIVIPKSIRADMSIKSGTVFAIMEPKRDMIVLKKIENEVTKEDIRLLKLVEKSWEDLEKGRFKEYSTEEFFRRWKHGKL